ncbi:hypothetical protein AMTRI_Chr12g235890 [Amborella trichopoda]
MFKSSKVVNESVSAKPSWLVIVKSKFEKSGQLFQNFGLRTRKEREKKEKKQGTNYGSQAQPINHNATAWNRPFVGQIRGRKSSLVHASLSQTSYTSRHFFSLTLLPLIASPSFSLSSLYFPSPSPSSLLSHLPSPVYH